MRLASKFSAFFKSARPDHVQVESSSCCCPRASWSFVRPRPGRHEVLTNGTWHVLLQSENIFELGGITMTFKTQMANFFSWNYNQTPRSATRFSLINVKTVHLDQHGIFPHLRCKRTFPWRHWSHYGGYCPWALLPAAIVFKILLGY